VAADGLDLVQGAFQDVGQRVGRGGEGPGAAGGGEDLGLGGVDDVVDVVGRGAGGEVFDVGGGHPQAAQHGHGLDGFCGLFLRAGTLRGAGQGVQVDVAAGCRELVVLGEYAGR
jgi:hypothetical protein